MLTDKEIDDFIELYKKKFGKEIGREEAIRKGAKLVRLVEAILKPKDSNPKKAEHIIDESHKKPI